MSSKILILGAGGHARVIADMILKTGDPIYGFLDDNVVGDIFGIPILGKISEVSQFSCDCAFVCGIGENQARKRVVQAFNVDWCTVIHPSAVIAANVTIGSGSVVMAGAIINTTVQIGRHCIINTGAVIEHDSILEDYVHVSPHATLCGTVCVQELTHIGAGATVCNNTMVTRDCKIGAGAVVVQDIEEPGTYVGIPARRLYCSLGKGY